MVDYVPRRRRRREQSFQFSLPTLNLSFSNMTLWSKVLKYCFFALIAFIVIIPLLFLWYSRDLPTPGKLILSKYKDATRIYDRKGTLLFSVYQDENRTYSKLNDIPKYLQEGTIAIEDKDFYKNNGFSITGYVRVVWNFIRGQGLAGASTISQQLVKNVLLTSERSLPRKIKELILSIQINQIYTKDQILEMYMNNIPYGGSAVGAEAAAETYFGKKVGELDLAQSAFLSGLPQSPSVYSPFSGNKYYLGRTQAVLTQMVNDGYITSSQSKAAYTEIANYQFSQHNLSIKAPHWVFYIKQKLAEQFGESAVETGGLQVYTTLDYDVQQKAEDIVKSEIDNLKAYHVSNGASIVTNPKNGEILAMVGSKDYFDDKNDGNYNAAVAANRQPGSSLKPIIYATAFEKGYTPSTLLMDVKTDFPTNDPTAPIYTPVNYDGKFHGPIQVRYALANSFNIPAVKMLAKIGIQPAMQKAYDMGIQNWQPTPDHLKSVGLSLVLGGRETTLLDEVTAYGVFANQGVKHTPFGIEKVTDSRGNTLYEHKDDPGQKVLSPEVAYLISNILTDNNARTLEFGSNSSLVIPGKTVSVKTGTTDLKRDNWTLGYTPSYVVGVWVGNNDNAPMSQSLASGITGAAPIWNKIMSAVLKGKTDEPQPQPSNVISLTIDGFAGGLPHGGQPTRTEYYIKGTEPTGQAAVYQTKDAKDYLVFKEDDPVSTDGHNRWQEGIMSWIQQNHAGDQLWNPPSELYGSNNTNSSQTPTPTPNNQSSNPTATPGSPNTPTPTGIVPTVVIPSP